MKRSKDKSANPSKKAKASHSQSSKVSGAGTAGANEPGASGTSTSSRRMTTRQGNKIAKAKQLESADTQFKNAQIDQDAENSSSPMDVEQEVSESDSYDDDGFGLDYEEEPMDSLGKEDSILMNPNDSKDGIPSATLSGDEIIKFMDHQINETISVLSIHSPTTTRLLLNVFRWDKQALILKFFDSLPEIFDKLTKSKLFLDRSSDFVLVSHGTCQEEHIGECQICFEPVSPGMFIMFGTSCGHSFCEECWKDFIRIHIRDNGILSKFGVIHCPGSNCEVPINDASVLRYLQAASDSAIKKLYQRGIASTFVECDKKLQWCPNPCCGNVVKVSDPDHLIGILCPIVQCTCETKFCFHCGTNPHEPITCKMLAKWNSKNKDDSETVHWKMVNTKHCPKCSVSIEKNGGCNHMICSKQGCRFEFCWICLGSWSDHGYAGANGSCNRYNAADPKNTNESEALALLQRYLHYYNLYRAHQQSLDTEANNLGKLNKKIGTLVGSGVCTWIDAKFLYKAIETLRACRLTLIHTYAFAYFIEPNNQQHIFEDNQADLHTAVEALSYYLENEFINARKIEYLAEAVTKENVADTSNPKRLEELTADALGELQELKTFILNKSTYCDQRRLALLKHIEEGCSSENCWWKFTL